MKDPAGESFHVDKRIPLALIVTLLIQTGGIAWWASAISSAQAEATKERVKIETRVGQVEASRDDLKERVIRIESKIEGQNETLQRILQSVQRPAN